MKHNKVAGSLVIARTGYDSVTSQVRVRKLCISALSCAHRRSAGPVPPQLREGNYARITAGRRVRAGARPGFLHSATHPPLPRGFHGKSLL